ncbi:MAG: methyltransferase domain-containing protein [Pseudomonadota bacterium]
MSSKQDVTTNYPLTPSEWLSTPLGEALLEQETRIVQETVEDVFGEECVQIGRWGEDTRFLTLSRTQRSLLVGQPGENASVIADWHRLPIQSDSVDSVILPHTLDYSDRPHAVLREVHRILRASGHLIQLGFRPGGLWGLRRLVPGGEYPPGAHDLLSDRTVRDWMKLLDMRIYGVHRYFFRWPLQGVSSPSSQWERRGRRYWPELSACYMIAAQKRVTTLTPVRPVWSKKAKVVAGLVETANRVPKTRFDPKS